MYGILPYVSKVSLMSGTSTRNARLETRIAAETLALARRAAELQGRSLSDFVAAAVQSAARRAIEEAHVLQLTLEGQQRFAQALMEPPEPGDGLLRAVQQHRDLIGEP
ncbi:UNVERIFIED_CONTAM: DUF1778 domain-containing protein [Methylobacteriaceae bacterium AG10]|nr:DUF1778 domain-containing protein [Methylobacteriaceae bacterium AG10]